MIRTPQNVEQPVINRRLTNYNPYLWFSQHIRNPLLVSLMILQGLLLVSTVIFYPVLPRIWLSFNKYHLLRIHLGQQWAELDQYAKLIDEPIF